MIYKSLRVEFSVFYDFDLLKITWFIGLTRHLTSHYQSLSHVHIFKIHIRYICRNMGISF